MARLHMRLSMELEVTKEQLAEIVQIAKRGGTFCGDVDISEIAGLIDLDKAVPCDWDDMGYLPSNWIEYDALEAGVLSVEEVGN